MIAAQDEIALKEAMDAMVKQIILFDRKKIAEIAQNKFSYSVIGKAIDTVYSEVLTVNIK
jgi:hypothetical protein